MPWFRDDDSKAHRNITELQQQWQQAKAELDGMLAGASGLSDGKSRVQREREVKARTDRLQRLTTALDMQRQLVRESSRQSEQKLAQAGPKKMKNLGFRSVKIRCLGGLEIELFARSWCRSEACAEKGKGAPLGLVLLGLCDRCTPALASEVAPLAAALSSLEEAQARLEQRGVQMSVKKIATVAYHFAQRARARQPIEGLGIAGSLAGRRVVISSAGGRLRVRKPKRTKTAKGRHRYRTDWREPKLRVMYVVAAEGRLCQEFIPVIEGTLQGPDEVFRLREFYRSPLDIHAADQVLFIADGAKWIWNRVGRLWPRLGLVAEQCWELVDFYPVVEQVNALAQLKKAWSSAQRKRWVTQQRKRLLEGEVPALVEEIKRFCRGQRGKGWRRERASLLRNAEAGRLDYGLARFAQMPIGSGAMESAVRRVVNLRMKGAGIFWDEDHAEEMLLLRTYYKAKHWQVLENKAFAPSFHAAA